MFRGSLNRSGFTLIELLVVIAIISLLSSVVLSSLSNARASARDARRASDFNQLRTAVELYRNNNNGEFPGGDTSQQTYQVSDNCTGTQLYQDLVDGGYLQQMPTDPNQTTEVCSGYAGDSPTLHSSAGVNDEYFYGWDADNVVGDFPACFSINNFETSDDPTNLPGDLQNLNEQIDTNFGGDANMNNAEFVFCFAEEY